jgi:glycine cleavage system H protein
VPLNAMTPLEQLLGYRFSDEHVWIADGPDAAPVGLTDHMQGAMGEMVFVDPPEVGRSVRRGDSICELESVKAVADTPAPVSGVIVSVNDVLADHPELCNDDPYGRGWLVRIRPDDPADLAQLHTLVGYRAEVLEEVEHVLFLDEQNRIRYFPAVRTEEGLVLTESPEVPSFITGGLVNAQRAQRLELADEFEELINDPRVTERALQEFFERNPDFLLGAEYEELHSQVVLRRADEGTLRPDFILRPLAGVSREAQIVDLKLPRDRVVKHVPNRVHLYDKIHEAVAQLRTYARYFEEHENREHVQRTLGFTSYVPKVTLIVGKTIELDAHGDAARALARAQPVDIVTYTDVLRRYRRLAELS